MALYDWLASNIYHTLQRTQLIHDSSVILVVILLDLLKTEELTIADAHASEQLVFFGQDSVRVGRVVLLNFSGFPDIKSTLTWSMIYIVLAWKAEDGLEDGRRVLHVFSRVEIAIHAIP